jgi:hypothetical protein
VALDKRVRPLIAAPSARVTIAFGSFDRGKKTETVWLATTALSRRARFAV